MTDRVRRAVRGLAVAAAVTLVAPAVLAAQVGWSASGGASLDGAEPALGLTQQGDSVYRLAQERLNRGDYRAAATLFAQVAERNPRSAAAPRALYFRAFALSRTGNQSDLRDALRTLDELERRFPDRARDSDAGALRLRVCGELARRGDA
ncbi:MAG TPA: tetratricopeptide repeat protein, partial [Gemmatimonadaceae bacterium]